MFITVLWTQIFKCNITNNKVVIMATLLSLTSLQVVIMTIHGAPNKGNVGIMTTLGFHGANMGPTWVLSAPDGPHVGPMNLAIRDGAQQNNDNRPMPMMHQISHNAPLCNRNVHICYKNGALWDMGWCIVGFVQQVYGWTLRKLQTHKTPYSMQ